MATTSNHLDALGTIRQRSRAVIAFGSLAAILVGAWSFWPLRSKAEPTEIIATTAAATKVPAAASRPVIDPSSFAAALWREPPVVEPMGPPRPPLPALRLQLLGVRSGAVEPLGAMIYDTELDSITVVKLHEVYRGFKVVRIDRGGLELDGGEQRIVLSMDENGKGDRGGGR